MNLAASVSFSHLEVWELGSMKTEQIGDGLLGVSKVTSTAYNHVTQRPFETSKHRHSRRRRAAR